MEKQESKSNWDDLVHEIGVEVPPEIQQREAAAANAAQQSPPAIQRPEPRSPVQPPPKRAAVDWNSLAGELGLPPIADSAPPAADELQEREPRKPPEVARPTELPAEEQGGRREEHDRERHQRGGRRERQERADRPRQSDSRSHQRDERGATRDRGEKTEQEEGKRREEGERGDRGSRQERESGGRGRQRGGRGRGRGRGQSSRDAESAPRGERREPRRSEPDYDRPDEAEIEPDRDLAAEVQETAHPEQPEEQPKSNAAVSLWHKIFGSPTDQAAKIVDESRDESSAFVTGAARDEPRGEGTGFSEPQITADIEGPPYREESDYGDRSAVDDEDTQADQRRGRPRRRRGRGRGRGRSPEEHSTSELSSERGDVDSARPEARGEFDDDDDMDDTLADLGDEADVDDAEQEPGASDGGRRKSALQRAIPSWDEAIGYIVDTNMATRSQRRPPARSGGRDNGPRGRSRGRRKN